MKTPKVVILGALLLAAAPQASAVVDQALQIQGTNLVLSWPSPGRYQEYLIQHRQTLDTSTPWTALTNNYFANSTNRTTYTIVGAVPPPFTGGGGGGGTNNRPPAPMSAASAAPMQPMAVRADGAGPTVPLALYPPCFDLSDFLIYDPAGSNWVSGSAYTRPALSIDSLRGPQPQDGPSPDGPGPGGDDPPNSGFYRVFHIPDWSFNVTNYTYDGPTFFPVDFADYMDRVDNTDVLLNGGPTPYAVFTSYTYNGQTNWGVGIFFDRVPNGTYQIQLVSTLRLSDEIGDTTTYLMLTNLSRSIVVNNQVVFTNSSDLILSGTYNFNAHLKNTNTDWWIDIYDAWGNYVNTGSGHTYNGQVSWNWGLTDYNGYSRDNSDSDPYFDAYITFNTAGAGSTTTRRTPPPAAQYPSVGGWIISYSDRQLLDAGTNYTGGDSYYQAGINELVGGPALKLDPVSKFAIKFGTNVYSQADRDGSWINLKAYMSQPSLRNFYYYGHGSPTTIGADMHTFNSSNYVTGGITLPGSHAYLTSKTIRDQFSFNKFSGARPYRFVFLDGCNTANGDWPDAFGVGKSSYTDTSWYGSTKNTRHVRPSAFVGWTKVVGGPGWGTAKTFWDFRSYWMGFWANSIYEPLNTALDDGNTYSDWVSSGQFWGAIKVYGYTMMQMEDYNHKGDWTWP